MSSLPSSREVPKSRKRSCQSCFGYGLSRRRVATDRGVVWITTSCTTCRGTGQVTAPA